MLLDWNALLIRTLQQHHVPDQFQPFCHDVLSGQLWQEAREMDLAVMDPPWYPEHYTAFLAQASAVTRIGAQLFVVLLPTHTRPEGSTDRWQIFETAHTFGFALKSLQPGLVRYQTPPFEQASLAVEALEVEEGWRTGDLATFEKVAHPRPQVVSSVLSAAVARAGKRDAWAEVLFAGKKIKLRGPFTDAHVAPALVSIERDDTLPTVSRLIREERQLICGCGIIRYLRSGAKLRSWWPYRRWRIRRSQSIFTWSPESMSKRRWLSCSATQRSAIFKHNLFGRVVDHVMTRMPLPLQEIAREIERSPQPLPLDVLSAVCARHQYRGHLAVLTPPYLHKILQMEKTIESRFSQRRIQPFHAVHANDVVFLKMTAGPICAVVQVTQARFFGPLSAGEAKGIMEQYQSGLQLDVNFQESKQNSRYASLLFLSTPVPIQPVRVKKVDRRPWVVLNA